MKGIILAGGAGTRLYPNTQIVNKQLLPVYDKPMIYYPLATLMLCGIRDILIISTSKDIPHYQDILGNGGKIGVKLYYQVEERPEGIAKALIIGEDYLAKEPVCLILGDNVFYGQNLPKILQQAGKLTKGALIFAYWVDEPERFGVVEFNQEGKVLSLEEKPTRPKSNYAVPGLYFYDEKAARMARMLKPSLRGELEITDLNQEYLKIDQLNVQVIGRGIAWFDTGTPKSMLEAANYIAIIEKMHGEKIACIEEIALTMDYINKSQFMGSVDALPKGSYQDYLLRFLKREK